MNIVEVANCSYRRWSRWYAILSVLHYVLGTIALVASAVLATNNQLLPAGVWISVVGIISTVCVGGVAFVKPNDKAAIFFDAYSIVKHALVIYEQNAPDDPAGAKVALTREWRRAQALIGDITPAGEANRGAKTGNDNEG